MSGSPGGTEVGRVSVRVLPDVSDFRKKLKADLEKATKGLEVEIPVEVDSRGALLKLAALKKAVDNIGDANARIDVSGGAGVALDQLITKTAALRNEAGKIGNGFRDSEREVNKFRRAADHALDGLQSVGKGLANTIGAPIALITGGLGDMNRTGLMVVGVLLLIPPILGIIGALIGGLPSLLFAFGAAAGVVALGLDGIKKAGEAFTKTLAPLRAQLSSIFEKGLTTQLGSFAKILNGPLKNGLKGVADGLLAFSKGFFDALTSAKGIEQINNILTATKNLFAGLGVFMKSFTSGLLTLGEAGARSFGPLIQVMVTFGERFNDMAKRVAGNGLLQKSLEALADVTDALLDVFLQLVEQGMAVMVQIGAPLADLLRALGPLFGALLPILGTLFNAFAAIITALAINLTPVFLELQPIIAEFARIMVEALIPVIRILAPMIVPLAGFFLQLFNALSPLFGVMQPIANLLAGVLTTAIQVLTPLIQPLSDLIAVLAAVFSEAIAQAMPIIQEFVVQLGQGMAGNMDKIMEVLPGLITSFIGLLDAILPLLPPLGDLIADIMPSLIEFIGKALKAFTDLQIFLNKWLIPVFKVLIPIIGDTLRIIFDLASGLLEALVWIGELPGKIINLLVDAGKWLVEAGRNVIKGFLAGMRGEFPSMQNIVRGWFDGFISKIKDGLKINSPSKVFIGIGKSVMEGFGDGIIEGGPMAINPMKDAVEQLQGIGTNMTGTLQADGTVKVVGDGIETAVEKALSNWTIEFDPQGVARLVNKANEDNRAGR